MHIGTSSIKHQTSDDGDSDTYQITYYSTRRRISPKARSSRIRGGKKQEERRGERCYSTEQQTETEKTEKTKRRGEKCNETETERGKERSEQEGMGMKAREERRGYV